ncbi:serine/threonine protein kinase HipA of HipAB toxin-antitoxin module [Paraburkholderia sp. JPY419]
MTHKGPRVLNYFDNLLPDSDAIRKRIAQRYRTETLDAFDLLRAIGRDCVGAVQLLGEDDAPVGVQRIEGTPLSDDDIEALLAQTVGKPTLGAPDEPDDFRISLAGAQEKTALLWHDGQWQRPHGATPTTHIFKLPLGLVGNRLADLSTSVENEWLCMRILREFGLPVANTEVLSFGQQRVLAVERFDRQMHSSGSWLLRLPQEDFCQVYGVPSHRKYENEGGPGVLDLARILQQSVDARQDLETLLASQILFWMLAAPDGHAKNFSIRLLAGGQYRLTPLYDVMSIWPVEGNGPNQWPEPVVVVQGAACDGSVVAQQARCVSRRAAASFQRDGVEVFVRRQRRAADPASDRADARRDRAGVGGVARALSGQGRRADFQGTSKLGGPARHDAGELNALRPEAGTVGLRTTHSWIPYGFVIVSPVEYFLMLNASKVTRATAASLALAASATV